MIDTSVKISPIASVSLSEAAIPNHGKTRSCVATATP